MSKLKYTLFALILISLTYITSCTPDSTEPEEEPTVQGGFEIEIWSSVVDTFFVYDTTDTFNIFADVTSNGVFVTDSTLVRFYTSLGSVTEKTYTLQGQASTIFNPVSSGGVVEEGEVTLIASSGADSLVYDTLKSYVKIRDLVKLISLSPEQGSMMITEEDTLTFKALAYNPSGGGISYSWLVDSAAVAVDSTFKFAAKNYSVGTHTVQSKIIGTYQDRTDTLTSAWTVNIQDIDNDIIINEITPSLGGLVTIDELDTQTFTIDAEDPDGSTLSYIWKLDGITVSETDSYTFTTDYTSAGVYALVLTLSDETSDDTQEIVWAIKVEDVNRPIVINSIFPSNGGSLSLNEGETQNFSVDAVDPDGNMLSYEWRLNGTLTSTTTNYQFVTDYTSAGSYTVSLVIGDTQDTTSVTWSVIVFDVDQEIVINEILPSNGGNFTMIEGNTQVFSIDAIDPDGNSLTYSWKLNNNLVSTLDNYTFSPDFTMAGFYVLELSVNDGQSDSEISINWYITVEDGDAPIIINSVTPDVGDLSTDITTPIEFLVDAVDPDGNTLIYDWKLDNITVSTNSDYTFSPETTGRFDLVLTLSDGQGRDTQTLEWIIFVE